MAERGAGRLRRRLTGVAALVLAAILVLASVLIVLVFQRSVDAAADDLSRTRALDVAPRWRRGPLTPVLTDVGDDSVAQVVGSDDGACWPRRPTSGTRARSPASPRRAVDPRRTTSRTCRDDDETEDFRVWAVTARGPAGPAVVYVGHSTEATGETVASLVGPSPWACRWSSSPRPACCGC